jgi:hypothetical protein
MRKLLVRFFIVGLVSCLIQDSASALLKLDYWQTYSVTKRADYNTEALSPRDPLVSPANLFHVNTFPELFARGQFAAVREHAAALLQTHRSMSASDVL